jgi:hypothetical protein
MHTYEVITEITLVIKATSLVQASHGTEAHLYDKSLMEEMANDIAWGIKETCKEVKDINGRLSSLIIKEMALEAVP